MTAVAVAAASIAALAGCGGSKPAYCTDKTNLQNSINQLKNVDVSSQGLSTLQNQLKNVENSAKALAASAKNEFGPQVDALKTSLSSLGSAVQTAASAPSAQSLSTVAAGVSDVQATFKTLANAVDKNC
jgi:capsule polysaccharide export protein KpsE/RkpR